MGDDKTFDETDLRAAQAVISLEGWPSRLRAEEWLARILRAGANQAVKMSREAGVVEREACAVTAHAAVLTALYATGRQDTTEGEIAQSVATAIRARGNG